jgi:hypothetical protein
VLSPSPSPEDSNIVKLRLEEFKVVVLREAAYRHLIVGEAVRRAAWFNSADYAV